MKNNLLIAGILYATFVVYGSLVPWQFNSMPLTEAWHRFQNIEYLTLGIASRADWVANILLFIPLAFLWLGVISLQKQVVGRFLSSVFVLLASFLLCSAIEFTQLFFPPRTVSLNDILAESLGALIGTLAWWIFGKKFITWIDGWQKNKTNSVPYLQFYLGCMFFYSVMPLDLTLSPVEFYHKWREGRVILLPFSGLKGDLFRDIYDCLADVILWLPIPWLWLKIKPMSKNELLKRVLLSAAIIEFFQLFVYSRVTDVTDIFLAFVGGVFGLKLIGLSSNKFALAGGAKGLNGYKNSSKLIACLAYLLWILVVCFVFLYPYNFEWSYLRLSAWSDKFFRVPFYAYYYGTEYRAVTEFFHKVMFFMPFGVVSAYVFSSLNSRRQVGFIVLATLTMTAFGVEIFQLFLPNKNADITDVILEVFGGCLGYLLTKQLKFTGSQEFEANHADDIFLADPRFKSKFSEDSVLQSDLNGRKGQADRSIQGFLALVSVFITFGVLVFISSSEAVPYNLRELFSKEHPVSSALGVTVLIYWCFAYPIFSLIHMLKKDILEGFFYVRFLVVHSLIAWVLVRAIVPLESIHDVLGSPILMIHNELELAFRFFALFGIYSLTTLSAAHLALLCFVSTREMMRLFILGVFWALLLLPFGYWVVVIQAATDNLTELMSDNGYSLSIVCLGIYLFLVCWLGSSISFLTVFRGGRRIVMISIVFIISFPLGYQLLNWGTEQFIVKYDTVFSALQFLLSTDRSNFITGDALRMRFFIMHLGLVSLFFLTQNPVFFVFSNSVRLRTRDV